MQSEVKTRNRHLYPSITLSDSSTLHAGDVNIFSEDLAEKKKKENEHKCHQTFKTSAYEDHKNRNVDRVEGTCQWVLSHPHFRSWRTGTHQNLLWISADPGCGKSVLAKSFVDHDLNDGSSNICYFFFKDNEIQDNLSTALCALLHQLFTQQPELIVNAIPSWQENGNMLQKETGEMWRILLQSAFDPAARPTICVFDALDECCDDDRRRLISLLCDHLRRPDNRLRFIVTGRPYDKVQRWFEQSVSQWPQIRLRGEDENEQIREEIDLVIDQHVQTLAFEILLTESHQEKLRRQLLHMQNRTYLWLHLVIEEIRETYQNSLYPEDEYIESLPASVEEAYERILQKISAKQRPTARKILLIIVGARRPLKIGEMALALAAARPQQTETEPLVIPETSHLEKQIRQWCGLFVFVQGSTLYLIHQTAKEFLLSDSLNGQNTCTDTKTWRASLSLVEAETLMAKLSTMYLFAGRLKPNRRALPTALDEDSDEEAYARSSTAAANDFYQYCAECWTSHFQDRMAEEEPQLTRRALSLYDTESDEFSSWFQRFRQADRSHPKNPTLSQHVIASIGHESILLRLHQKSCFDVDVCDNQGRTALWWAARQGHVRVLEWLLNMGADVNARAPRIGTALHVALNYGHDEIALMLLDRGADINACDEQTNTALHIALQNGHEKMAWMLLVKGADINARDQDGQTPLHLAALQDREEKVMQILLDQGAAINARESAFGRTALHQVSKHGYVEVAQTLLDGGADINAKDDFFQETALHYASRNCHKPMVQMLLDRGADVEIENNSGLTALNVVGRTMYDEITRLFRDYAWK